MSHAEYVTVGDRGRIVLPAGLRADLKLATGSRLVITTEEDASIRLRPLQVIADDCRGLYSTLASGLSLADELSAERRAEAANE